MYLLSGKKEDIPTLMAKGHIYCHGKRTYLLSWQKDISTVMAKGHTYSHGKRTYLLSWQKEYIYCQDKRGRSTVRPKGIYLLSGQKGCIYCYGKKDTVCCLSRYMGYTVSQGKMNRTASKQHLLYWDYVIINVSNNMNIKQWSQTQWDNHPIVHYNKCSIATEQ